MDPELVIPVVMVGGSILAYIVVVLTKHQQKMAEILHRTQMQAIPQQSDQTRRDIDELKQLVHQQTIQIDNLSNRIGQSAPTQPPVQPPISERLNS